MSYYTRSVMVLKCDHPGGCLSKLEVPEAEHLQATQEVAENPPGGWTSRHESYESYGWPEGPRTRHKLVHYCPRHAPCTG